jgi:hypothetical protein
MRDTCPEVDAVKKSTESVTYERRTTMRMRLIMLIGMAALIASYAAFYPRW